MTDMPYFWVVPLLIIAGWGITWWITTLTAKRTHKKNDRINLISKKNDLLRDLSQQAKSLWAEGGTVNFEEYSALNRKVSKIKSVYYELKRDHKDPIPPALDDLHEVVSLDIENKDSEALKNRMAEIKRIIKELHSHPAKF